MGRGLSESVKKGKFVTKTFFSDIPSISILPVKYGGRGGGGEGLLNGQNLLSVTKVICLQSFSLNTVKVNLLKTLLILPKTKNLN